VVITEESGISAPDQASTLALLVSACLALALCRRRSLQTP
jgi:hypothetical protein